MLEMCKLNDSSQACRQEHSLSDSADASAHTVILPRGPDSAVLCCILCLWSPAELQVCAVMVQHAGGHACAILLRKGLSHRPSPVCIAQLLGGGAPQSCSGSCDHLNAPVLDGAG